MYFKEHKKKNEQNRPIGARVMSRPREIAIHLYIYIIDVCVCVCVFIINSGTLGALSTKLDTHITYNPEKNAVGEGGKIPLGAEWKEMTKIKLTKNAWSSFK